MSSINYHIANSTGVLTNLTPILISAFEAGVQLAETDLIANQIDVIFISNPDQTIPEYGISGYSPGPNHIYISLDPKSDKITRQGLVDTLLHEIHHCMRWRGVGYGETLGEALISEGLASLYEQEHSGKAPIYTAAILNDNEIKLANALLYSKSYDHNKWFYGKGDITRWFGYTYGYMICNKYGEKMSLSAADLVNTPAKEIIKNYL